MRIEKKRSELKPFEEFYQTKTGNTKLVALKPPESRFYIGSLKLPTIYPHYREDGTIDGWQQDITVYVEVPTIKAKDVPPEGRFIFLERTWVKAGTTLGMQQALAGENGIVAIQEGLNCVHFIPNEQEVVFLKGESK